MRGQQAQRVKFSPHFLRELTKWLNTLRQAGPLPEESGGFLFGAAGKADCVIQAFEIVSFKDQAARAWQLSLSQQRRSEDYSAVNWLDLLGWFSLRPYSNGGLLPSDVQFHSRYFPDSSKLALIFHSATEQVLSAELYTQPVGSTLETGEPARMSVQFAVSPDETPAVTRPKLPDETFLHVYDVARALDRARKWDELKERMPWLRHFDRFRNILCT